jgi:hypothetical protein
MFRRDEFGFPTFWTVQIVGWIGFYLLVIVAIFPEIKKPGMLRANSISVLSMFFASFLLYPICRYLRKQTSSWIELELRAFAWCVPLGALSGLVCEATIFTTKPDGGEWLVDSVQSAIVLFLWCSLYFSIKQWQQAARERERLLRAEAEIRDAKLSALRYQLNPHFLFNSLNAVSTLILEGDAAGATRMLAQIGELLRSTLNGEVAPEIPLSHEIVFTQRYLAIEQTRLGRRLRMEISIAAETLDALVPSMLLQPLVENAVRHGVAPLVEGGVLRIASHLAGDRLRIAIRNTGASGEQPSLQSLSANGIGLKNTAERLETLYPADHQFDLRWPEDGGCEVTVEIPFHKAVPERSGLSDQEVALCAH